ncbi:MAG: leucine-rich repeat protein [Lachnospiraceae bacterium]|nr:leucine-rich repeat protein [Lachnospiraceae bacterium]
MKSSNSIMKQLCFIFSIVIVIMGNIILNQNIALGAEKKNIRVGDKKAVQYISHENNLTHKDDNDELFEGYLNKLFFGDNKKSGDFGASNMSGLNDNEKKIYTKLKDIITEIADGKRKETIFTLDNLNFYAHYEYFGQITKDEVVQSFFTNEFNIDKIFDLLLLDCPYELYWYNKSKGVEYSYSYSYNPQHESGITKIDLTLKKITFKYQVASDYAEDAGNNQYYTYRMDASKVKRAQEAKSNAFSIVQKYMNLDDYDKLYAYKNEICNLVEYDDRAAGKGDLLTINDPWQLISVFDNDNTTNVVCEGYSKAFAYLCENSNFQNNIKCYIVTGTMKASTEGGHMWNIVTMENGKSYIVDITNCDGNGMGAIDQLFLAGLSGNVDAGYTFTNKKGHTAYYTYDESIKQLYPKTILALSDTNYRLKPEQSDTIPDNLPNIPSEIPQLPATNPEPEVPSNKPVLSLELGKKIVYGNANYKVISTDGFISVQFTGIRQKTRNVVIPAAIKVNGQSFNVTDIADNAMKNNKKVTKLTVGKNIEHIGKNAFRGCKNLKKIVFKTKKLTTEKIGSNAFKGINSRARFVTPE